MDCLAKKLGGLAALLLLAAMCFATSAAFAETGSALSAGSGEGQGGYGVAATVGSGTVSISKAKVGKIASVAYDGKKHTPVPSVTYGSTKLEKGVDFSVSYKSNVKAGKATVVLKGKGVFASTTKTTFKIKKAAISKAKVKSIKSRKYRGKAIKPSPRVEFHGKKLKKGRDYKLSYKNNKGPGVAKVIVKGKGNFKGKKVVKFRIKKPASSNSGGSGGSGGTVYITRTGSKFHRDGCSSLRSSKIAISRSDAISRGYDACKNCRP